MSGIDDKKMSERDQQQTHQQHQQHQQHERDEYSFSSLMLEFIGQNKIIIVAYVIVLIIVPLNEIGIPHTVGKLMESFKNKSIGYNSIYMLVIFICLIQLGSALSDWIEMNTFPMFQRFICNKILDYVLRMSDINLQEIHPGKIISIMAHSPRTLFNYLDVYRVDLLPQLVVFITAIVYTARISWKLVVIIVGIIIVYYIMAYFTLRNCSQLAMVREQYLISVNEHVDDVLANTIGILNAGTKEKELNAINDFYDQYKAQGEATLKCTLKYKSILMPIALLSIVAFVVTGYWLVRSDQIKVESFVTTVVIYLYIFNSIIRTINDVKDTAFRGGMMKEHLNIFKSMDHPPTSSSMVKDEFKNKYIVFDGVTFSYKSVPVLSNFNLEIFDKEKLLIMGPIGSGKTTILRMLLRYNAPESGHIYLKGVPLSAIPRTELRHRIGYIPQNPVLLNKTLYENIVYGSEHVSREEVMRLIKEIGLSDVFDADFLEKRVGKYGTMLSGGQRQVVWILRVIVSNPEILVLDEPTSAIDKQTKQFIDKLFKRVMQNRTVIVVSHDDYMKGLCDRIVSL